MIYMSPSGLSFPDGSVLRSGGSVTGPMAYAIAEKINATVARMRGNPQVGRDALDEFIDKMCSGKPELIACAENAFYWFNKCLATHQEPK